ncbi:Protein psi1 [Hypsizygus marmoreus]|uniref:Protein psi1 n=1 Tax=Hypsizygus marmoreus TaxID=39966 RepID=A0A369JWP2_HYPMA|nr:Protein psi1 [Hypsizygus marmoreus]
MSSKEPHEVLGVADNANIDEIRHAYKQMAKKWHPDRHIHIDGKAHAADMFAQVNNAYQLLIRDVRSTVQPVERAILATPISSARSSAESSSSIDSSSQIFTSHHSNGGSQTTPSSSLGGSIRVPKPLDRDAVSRVPRHYVDPPSNIHSSPHALASESRLSPANNTSASRIFYAQSQSQNVNQVVNRHRIKTGIRHQQPQSRVLIPAYGVNVQSDPLFLQPGPPLRSLGMGASGEWVYSLTLTLEEFFLGKHCRFCIVRHLLSGRSKNVMIEIDIPSGCQKGTKVLCRGVGHEQPNGNLQDMAFIIEEAPHDRFSRVRHDLLLTVQVPWTDALRRHPKRVYIRGLDGDEMAFHIDYARDKALSGSLSIRGAGMPVREMGKLHGRGNLVVRWELLPPQPRIRQFLNRFLHPRTK